MNPHLRRPPRIITLFGSSRPRPGSPDYALAYRMGKALAQGGFVICNGGYGGTMEAAAKGAKEGGGRAIGITLSSQRLRANPYLDRVEKKKTLLLRLERLVTLGEGYLVFKGGTGTLLEVALVLEYTHKQFSPSKPMVFVGDFWKKVVEKAREEVRGGSSSPFKTDADGMEALISFVSTPEAAVRLFQRILHRNSR